MIKGITSTLILLVATAIFGVAQNVPIQNYSTNSFGQVQLEIEAQADQYYLLTAQHEPDLGYETITSITMGVDGSLIITEPLAAYSLENYKVTAYDIGNPEDTDGDGVDDVTEFNNMPSQSPLNFAAPVPFYDGVTCINSQEVFSDLAVVYDNIPWAPFLNNQEFVKFAILNQDSAEPEIYFINSETHYIHADFYATIDTYGDDIVSGEVVYNPNEILPNGVIGSYSFNYSFGYSYSFMHTLRTFELLAKNLPFLRNNLQHFVGSSGEWDYFNYYKDDYEGSRINVVVESEYFADIEFLPFNQAEGYGFFRHMELDENPNSRDIVLYDALPNSLPRVGGIITSVVQTPLSHVNLRAIQDNVPNAYIKDPLEIDSIANLLGNYIYYKVEQDRYFIREASLDEVNEWYENIRPTEDQIPERDLTQTSILPLDSIHFDMSDAFGAKCANVATMRTFGFPEGTIPNGYGVPFYFYDEFMKYNGFYDDVEAMISDPEFINDLETRIDRLKDFRDVIKDADMPQWMLDELQAMHESWPEGTSIRCRSSTNNEDLPGFSGAGLYTSKTQHPWEGHISKSIKQVYASMWNFRAFDERDFYRIDHLVAAMGVLCHPNYEDELSNGVGVSIDPIYQTDNTFYLNTQVGEQLITNPEANEIPEEILLYENPDEGYFILRRSNLVEEDELVMGEEYLDQMRTYLRVIHDEFAILYNVVGAEGFGMDIEYKVTAENQLIIKQARPWVSFWANIKATHDLAVVDVISPQSSSTLGDAELVSVKIGNEGLKDMGGFEIFLVVEGQAVDSVEVGEELLAQTSGDYQFSLPQDFSIIGDYDLQVIVTHPSDGYRGNDTLNYELSKLHFLEGGISDVQAIAKCGNVVDLKAKVTNYGEATFFDTEIEVVVNGVAVDTFVYDFNIPYQSVVNVEVTVTENLQQNDNEITLNLLRVNGQPDAVVDNNHSSIGVDLESDYKLVTLIINADDYPQETSWELYDELKNELVDSGSLNPGDDGVVRNVCVDYGSCFKLRVLDSYGDGLCCNYGIGNFLMLDATGDTIVIHDGVFENEAEELFCLGDGCFFSAQISTTDASEENATDGMIIINPTSELEPYEYSIDGGESFVNDNTFVNLAPGTYIIVVRDLSETCIHQETVEVGYEIVNNTNDIVSGEIKVYPNPTEGNLIVEMNEDFMDPGVVIIEVYDCLGRRIQVETISRFENKPKVILSLKEYAPGSYFVKCYNHNFEKNFRVIKI